MAQERALCLCHWGLRKSGTLMGRQHVHQQPQNTANMATTATTATTPMPGIWQFLHQPTCPPHHSDLPLNTRQTQTKNTSSRAQTPYLPPPVRPWFWAWVLLTAPAKRHVQAKDCWLVWQDNMCSCSSSENGRYQLLIIFYFLVSGANEPGSGLNDLIAVRNATQLSSQPHTQTLQMWHVIKTTRVKPEGYTFPLEVFPTYMWGRWVEKTFFFHFFFH